MSQMDDLISVIKKGGLMNEIHVTILDDGALKIETGAFDSINHATADQILKKTEELLGGTRKKTVSKMRRHHSHTHIHQGQNK